MRLLADENFPFPVVEALRSFGYDVLTLSDLGKAAQALTDTAVLKLASDDARAVLTLNRKHFVRLHQSSPDHSGIVICSFDLDFDGQAKRIRGALSAQSFVAGQLLRINRQARPVCPVAPTVDFAGALARVKGSLATLAAPRP